jgi:hypothetical protein
MSLIPAGAVSWTDIKFFNQLCYTVYVFMRHCIKIYDMRESCYPFFLHECNKNENIIQNLRECNGNSHDLP